MLSNFILVLLLSIGISLGAQDEQIFKLPTPVPSMAIPPIWQPVTLATYNIPRIPVSWRWHSRGETPDAWTGMDEAFEVAFVAVAYVDWRQTRAFTQKQYWDGYYEANPILGKHPSPTTINQTFFCGIVGHYVVARMLPKKWRNVFQYVTLGLESGAVGHNFQVGIKMKM